MDLSELMKQAQEIQSLPEKVTSSGLYLSDFAGLNKFIKKEISKKLFQEKLFDSGYFLCGLYIADLISETAKKTPDKWYGIDYLIDDEYKKGGDLCFLICTLFSGRAERCMMKMNDYMVMGQSFYSIYYRKENKEIGYLMSIHYPIMTEIIKQAFRPL